MGPLGARRLWPVLAALLLGAGALGDLSAFGGRAQDVPSSPVSLHATAPATEAVLPLKLEQPADRLGQPSGGKHRPPLGLVAIAVGLPTLAAALAARRRSRRLDHRRPWSSPPSLRGPPALPLVATS